MGQQGFWSVREWFCMKKILTFLLLLLATATVAKAQPVCSPSQPTSNQCQAQAVNPRLTDILLGTQQFGPNRNNQTVKFSLSQILNLSGSTQYVPFSGGVLTGKLSTLATSANSAGFNIPPGIVPNAPQNGDVWETSAGLFTYVQGNVVGPLGNSGTINASSANTMGYYASSGTAISGLATSANGVLVTNGSSVPGFSTTLPSGLTGLSIIVQPKNYANVAALPSPTNIGQIAYVASCQNGSEGGGSGTGCIYYVNNSAAWTADPAIPTQQLTVGGQALFLGQSTVNQGTGGKIQLAAGTAVAGHCPQYDGNLSLVDSGAACGGGGGGGSGTVTAGTTNQLTWYSASGTTVAGLSVTNSAVLVTSGTGVPSESTTLPSGLSIPSPSMSNPVLTASGTYVNLTGTGRLATAASTTTQAGFNVAPGVAPTVPTNGDIWTTSAGALLVRLNGATVQMGTGNGTITSIATNPPITGGTVVNGAFTASCATCLTSTGGGAFAASAPLAWNATTSTLTLGTQTFTYTFDADPYTTVANATYYIFGKFPYTTGSITRVSYLTNGTSTPGFTVGIQVNGTNVATCNGISVTLAALNTTACGTNSIAKDNTVVLTITNTTGSPSNALVQVDYARSAI